jgi:hypothetical protein
MARLVRQLGDGRVRRSIQGRPETLSRPSARCVLVHRGRLRDRSRARYADLLGARLDRIGRHDTARRPSRLVIDMRFNGGGNTPLGQPLLHHLIGCPATNRRGALYVIIGWLTFSAAQNITTAPEQHTQATFAGEPTGSRPNFIGESVPFELPVSKVLVSISDLYWQCEYPMDRRPWIAPQLDAPPTFETYRRSHDPALAAILAATEQLPGS